VTTPKPAVSFSFGVLMKYIFMNTAFYPPSQAFGKIRQKATWLFKIFFLLFLLVRFDVNAFAQSKKTTGKSSLAKIRQTALHTLKASQNAIWFQKNEGQFGSYDILYGFLTRFGSMGVYNNKLRVVTRQMDESKEKGKQIVDITFPGSLPAWTVEPGKTSTVKGSYNTKDSTIIAPIFDEITLRNVYQGIDLRLYSGEKGALEFDWLVAKAGDYRKIKLNFTGQDSVTLNNEGDVVLNMKYEDMTILIPETYQVINGHKTVFETGMTKAKQANTFQYDIAGNINTALPLVIDPVMMWSTYMHNNTSTFDEYLYTIAVNTASEVYACGLTSEAMNNSYLSGVAPGFLSTYNYAAKASGAQQSGILYKLNAKGTLITAWTYTGMTNNIPVDMGIFPNNRVLIVYQTDTVQIYSADLTTRYYNDVISAGVATNVTSYQSQTIIDNDVFYLGGVASSALPLSIVPSTAPDNAILQDEGIILRITGATTSPTAAWGTYIGGSTNETFTAIAATPDKTKIAFAVHIDGGGTSFPSLVKPVDNIITGSELLIGNFDVGAATTKFNMLSFLGGSSNEGKLSTGTNAALVTADNNFFYVAGNTTSTDFPGKASGVQSVHGANPTMYDQFLSQIPLLGSAGTGFISTYNGGDANDIVGGLVLDLRTKDVLLFGSTESTDFPVLNTSLYSPFYQAIHGSTTDGLLDISYTVFANGLTSRKFSSFIGGAQNDYLGSTGKLKGAGHFQYNPTNGLTYIGTTIHSDETTLPTQWMSDIPGFDKSIPTATKTKDSHFIFSMNPNTDDFGDAPLSYDGVAAASSAVSFFNIRIGAETDAEQAANNSALANGDDLQNYGSDDDEDGIGFVPPIATGATTYSVTVSVFNNTGSPAYLAGWIDTDGNGVFDTNEYASVTVASSAVQQTMVLNFTGLPAFTTTTGLTYLRVRLANVPLASSAATGAFGKGEVEDYVVLQTLLLPIFLQKFTATPQDDNVLLNWLVSPVNDVAQYELQRGTSINDFKKIASLSATDKVGYSWLDVNPFTGVNYYRLKITSKDGTIRYSGVQIISFSKNIPVTVYPNPANNLLNILMGSFFTRQGTISFLSMDGKLLTQKKINNFTRVENIDVSHYPPGQYLLRIICGDTVTVKKIKVAEH
jgi:hypothetical protein